MALAETLTKLKTGFSRTFWVANTLELFERFAFYGSKAVLAVYLADAVGLGRRGNDLVGLYGFAVFCLPVLAGVVVDRFGFKRSLVSCFSIFCLGYLLVGLAGLPAGRPLLDALTPVGYVSLALLITAIGGSLIKPCIVGTVARTTTDETKSLGYSIYYSLVNFGGALGPILALVVRERFGIAFVLIMSASVSLLLAIATMAFFREPPGGGEGRTFGKILKDGALVLGNVRFMTFLVIFSGFWIMFWQIFYVLPFYAREVLKFEKFELLETADAWAICLFTVPITALANRFRPILAMTIGFGIASVSWLIIAIGASWQAVVIALVLFALGEMIQAPRYYEYVAELAPPEQTGTFMGFAFVPVAIGALVAGPLSGYLREHYIHAGRPGSMWTLLSAIGAVTTLMMIVYDRFVAPRKPDAARL